MINNRSLSKVVTFCLLSILSLIISSCKGVDDDVIPYVELDINPINIGDPTYWGLTTTYGCVMIENVGYKGNGIVVIRISDNEYRAYDATCTYEVKEGCAVIVNDSTFYGNVKCSCCGSKFDLNNYGSVTSGKARYPLKSYHVNFDGKYITIRN
jgi:Rieske Fe-S protein